jgi:hypothetical protein
MFHRHIHPMFVVDMELGGVIIQGRHGIIGTGPGGQDGRRTTTANVQDVLRQGIISRA